jgi:NlpC/P60 family putative phage cell wall peptidase
MITRDDIVACARTYLGTPFQHQGRIRGLSLDCIGLPICVARDLGIMDLDSLYRNYSPEPSDDTVLRECKKMLREKSIEQMKPGDVLCLKVPVPCHVAMVTMLPPNIGMIHAYSPNDKVVEHDIDFHWRRRIAGVFSFPFLED